ncbi:MAG: hypothetical protein AB4063_01100 [Crocosphaera sp.]
MTGIDRILTIRGLNDRLDPFAIKALRRTSSYFRQQYPDAQEKISQKGITGYIETLSNRLNKSSLDDTTQVLLSEIDIYAALIQKILDEDIVKSSDLQGLYNAVLRYIERDPKKYFLASLLTEVLNAKHIQVQPGDRKWQNLDELALRWGIPIRDGQVRPAVDKILDLIYKQGDLPHYLDEYIKKGEIEEHHFTSDIKQAMIDHLVKIGLNIKSEEEFQKSTYDEYFALAYGEALKRNKVGDDPIDVARTKDKHSDWDFSVEDFGSPEEQGIIPDNIKAAGVLDYVYYIGEEMGVFDVTNALVLRWANGSLDIPEGEAAKGLYRIHKLRHERSTPEERAMLYKRVLNRGDGQLLSSMIPNDAFPRYWHTLMSEVTAYISRSEGMRRGDNPPSRSPLYQAVRNIQYNLTDHMTGMSHLQVTEDYAHLQEALKILKTEEIINHFGGRRRNLWDVIERVAKEDLNITVQTNVMRTLAVEGDKVYKWIADFNEATVIEEEFQAFLRAAEAWIIAQASLGGSHGNYMNRKRKADFRDFDDDFGDDFDDDFDNDDDFDDW